MFIIKAVNSFKCDQGFETGCKKQCLSDQDWCADPQSWDLCCVHFPDSDQVVDKVSGGVGLSVLLVGGVAHPGVVEAINADLPGGESRVGTGWRPKNKT